MVYKKRVRLLKQKSIIFLKEQMKNFILYSKNGASRFQTMKELLNIRYIKGGAKLMYLFDMTGFLYAFYRRLYVLGSALLILTFALPFLLNIFVSDPRVEAILLDARLILNVFLVIFGTEIEEFFLKRSGYKIVALKTAKNLDEVRYNNENSVYLKQETNQKSFKS